MVKKKEIPISKNCEWSFDLIEEYFNHIERIATKKFKLDAYPNQLEIISSEQMIDAYCSHGLPLYFNHWSFGKSFVYQQEHYKRGHMGLAYEIVINSNPCISYLMEENTIMMQILVMAHACFGHNAFFKNNYLFKQWTDAEAIIDYLAFAKRYVMKCEEKYGVNEVEAVLDACHALQWQGVDKYKRPTKLSIIEEENRQKEREEYTQSQINVLWETIPKRKLLKKRKDKEKFPSEPQENVLYFIEKNAPNLETWKREIIRIVRKLAQYFYPQIQTKLMNEGFATFFHYHIVHELYEEGLIDDGSMLEFYQSHTNVIIQRGFDQKGGLNINPYALGFAIFQDIKRICTNPTEEDKNWSPFTAGNNDWLGTVKWAMENFKDESFILQFLSPKVIRDFKLFSVLDDDRDPKLEISAIHDDAGYRKIRQVLSDQYNTMTNIPDIQVYNVDRWGDRSLTLRHYMKDRRPLEEKEATEVLKHLRTLWGFDVRLESIDEKDDIRSLFEISNDETLLDVFLDDE